MAKFNVHVLQRVWEETWIEVDAESEEAAKDAARDVLNSGEADLQWSFLETCDEASEIAHVKQCEANRA